MEIKELKQRPDIGQNEKLNSAYNLFGELLAELRKRALPDEIVQAINTDIDQLNSVSEEEKVLEKKLRSTQISILSLIRKELKLVPKNYYRNIWMAAGMAIFGLPLGIVFGLSLDNLAFLSLGLPIGMVFGLAVGAGIDKKILEEGRQLDVET